MRAKKINKSGRMTEIYHIVPSSLYIFFEVCSHSSGLSLEREREREEN